MGFANGWFLAEHADPRRAEVEAFIADVYADAYGAQLGQFPPLLAAVTGPYGGITGAIGARPAGAATLFLDQYLDEPVERIVGRELRLPIARERIAEVGSLASTTPGFGKVLMSSLAEYLDGAGFEVVVFTATRQLRNSIRKWNATTFDFGAASGERLGDDQSRWGAYYDTDPRVLAVHLKSFRSAMGADPVLAGMLRTVWDAAWLDGARHRLLERAS